MVEIGASAEVTLVVGEADTAITHGSGEVPVLATPRVLALAEQAAVAALGDLGAGMTSVGVHAELDHVKATAIDRAVTARAEVVAVDGHRISFAFEVTEAGATVAHGTHRRVIVDKERFLG